MQITGLHHAQITIPLEQEDLARAFYCGVLGFQEVEKPVALQSRGGFWLQVGDRQVHVGTEAGIERTATGAHLAYQVDGIEACRQHIQAQGIEILNAVPIPGFLRFEFRDPFGNRVELIQPCEESMAPS